ncbi:MAG: hypothetical protein CMB80_04055 [Flammeovirgaceae bacterium]|nr:hypothetical protein [Flammeovirgaceae bacterium]MBE62592.1 hypothetical protein [Flammeovirgaceae bacterium]HCX20480.1 hypothetical protein [Cytophagales bacterium]|tara:strand:- start:436 stop:777 length:342 start_codon:yes stop_codon:yes gene_type:complete
MISLATYLTFLGFWFCYQTSQRAVLATPNKVEMWLRSDRIKGNSLGVVLLFSGLLLCIMVFGLGSGVFSFLILLTCVASLVIVLAPIQYINLRVATISGLILLTIEIFIHASK